MFGTMGAGPGSSGGGGGGGGGGGLNFEQYVNPIGMDWAGDVASMISQLNEDVGGNTAAPQAAQCLRVYDGIYGSIAVLSAINNLTPDAVVDQLSNDLSTQAEAIYAVKGNLEADVAGSSIAQAITDLTTIQGALEALGT